jgi:hypothetical protein
MQQSARIIKLVIIRERAREQGTIRRVAAATESCRVFTEFSRKANRILQVVQNRHQLIIYSFAKHIIIIMKSSSDRNNTTYYYYCHYVIQRIADFAIMRQMNNLFKYSDEAS